MVLCPGKALEAIIGNNLTTKKKMIIQLSGDIFTKVDRNWMS